MSDRGPDADPNLTLSRAHHAGGVLEDHAVVRSEVLRPAAQQAHAHAQAQETPVTVEANVVLHLHVVAACASRVDFHIFALQRLLSVMQGAATDPSWVASDT